MTVTLTPTAQQRLDDWLEEHPSRSAEEIVEEALVQFFDRGPITKAEKPLTKEQLQTFLEEMAQFAHKIPEMDGETFSREMTYQDHD